MKIPWALPNINQDDKSAVLHVLKSNWLTMGPEVKRFEKNLSSYLNIDFAIGTNTGTGALDIALKCLDITKGDEIIIPALTYIAVGNVVLYNQGIPIFVDVDKTFNINTSLIEEKITERTKAIINVDFGGNVTNYNELQRISNEYNIPLIVDGANSLGSEYHGSKCCTHGLINTTSFHAAKILTTIEGGMIFTNNKDLYLKAQAIRSQGEIKKYDHKFLGNNYRMMDIVAGFGNAQFMRFKNTLKNRREKVAYYKKHLRNVRFPKELKDTINCNLFFLILTKYRNQLYNYLKAHGIETRITYPKPINEQQIFREYSKEVFPMAKELSQKVISLPLYHTLTKNDQDYIIEKINEFMMKKNIIN